MALELSTIGITIGYCAETTAGTRPTTGYTVIPDFTDIPALNGTPDTLEVSNLVDTWKRYIMGQRDTGGTLALTANFTADFKTKWAALVTAYTTAATAGKLVWFEIKVPNFASFFFAGIPADMGFPGAAVNSVFKGDVYVTPNKIHGFDTSST